MGQRRGRTPSCRAEPILRAVQEIKGKPCRVWAVPPGTRASSRRAFAASLTLLATPAVGQPAGALQRARSRGVPSWHAASGIHWGSTADGSSLVAGELAEPCRPAELLGWTWRSSSRRAEPPALRAASSRHARFARDSLMVARTSDEEPEAVRRATPARSGSTTCPTVSWTPTAPSGNRTE